MAGHNKWSKIKHKKAITDAKKSKEFSRHSHLIATEVKNAGGDETAAAVKTAVEKAKTANMPADNIARAIERGKGVTSGVLQEVVYEAYGPGGVALIATGVTDNRNRTAAEVKHVLNTFTLSLAEQGAASWAFTKDGDVFTAHTTIPLSDADAEKCERIVQALEEVEDITGVYTNREQT